MCNDFGAGRDFYLALGSGSETGPGHPSFD